MQFDKFILFGDSITQFSSDQVGFALAPALQNLYARKLDVVTRGFGGYNTNQAVVILPEILKAASAENGNVKLMYIFMGTNDAATTFQHVPLQKYKENLDKLAKLTASYGIKTVLVSPALHDQRLCTIAREGRGDEQPFSSSATTREYADGAAEVARINKLPFVDLWTAFQKYGGWSTEAVLAGNVDLSALLVDGIHFTPEGYKVFFNELVSVINKGYPELAAENLTQILPHYSNLDYEGFEKELKKALQL